MSGLVKNCKIKIAGQDLNPVNGIFDNDDQGTQHIEVKEQY